MKKFSVMLLAAAVLVCGSVSASAATSPPPESSKPSSSSGTSSSTSPKTGATGTYAALMAGAALAFGGVAVGAKKKIGE